MTRQTPITADELAEHLHDCWPLLFNDGLQHEVAQECLNFIGVS